MLRHFVASYVFCSWAAHSTLSRETCSFIVDFNVPGKENPPRINLTAAVWVLSRNLPMGDREIGDMIRWYENGEQYVSRIIAKADDRTYDVMFSDGMIVEGVHEKAIEPFKGTLSSNYSEHLASS